MELHGTTVSETQGQQCLFNQTGFALTGPISRLHGELKN